MYGYGYQMPQQRQGLTWVQGEAGAKSYMVQPGNTVLLMDSESERFFLKTADPAGMPMPLRVFEYREMPQNAPVTASIPDMGNYVTRDELNDILANLPVCKCKKEGKKDESTV